MICVQKIKKQFFLLATILALTLPHPAGAGQGAQWLEHIRALNAQSSKRVVGVPVAGDIIGRRVVDNTNRVIGEVDDILIGTNGNFENFIIDLDGFGTIPLPARRLQRQSKSSFAVSVHRDDIGRLAADIETASGSGLAAPMRVSRLAGATVRGVSGQRYGTVSALVLGGRSRIQAIHVKSARGKVGIVALPVNAGMRLEPSGVLRLNSAYESALGRYLRE
jgi:sporulation protein YlmC with PRC-barrel domain